jgi:DNA-binding transcriptional regulator YiaG
MLAGVGTSTAYAAPPDMVWRCQRSVEQTTAGALVPSAQPAGAAIGALRRLTGLTWDQLARMFSVSRRSLHFWASGKPMAPSNEERLQRVLAVLRKIDRGAASANRTALLGVHEDGTIPFDLLVNGDYERALSLLGPGDGRGVSPPKLSEEARAARTPRPPEELVGALQDRIHPTSGRLLAAKPIATSRRK